MNAASKIEFVINAAVFFRGNTVNVLNVARQFSYTSSADHEFVICFKMYCIVFVIQMIVS